MTSKETRYWMEVFQAGMHAGFSDDKARLVAYEAVYHIRALNLPRYD